MKCFLNGLGYGEAICSGLGVFIPLLLLGRSFWIRCAPASPRSREPLVICVCQGLFCWVRLLDGNLLCRHLLASSLWCEVSRRSNGFDLRLFSCEDVTTLLLCRWLSLGTRGSACKSC